MSRRKGRTHAHDPPLVDENALRILVSKVLGLELEVAEIRRRHINYERSVCILERIRTKLHREGILSEADMDGLDAEFEKIPMTLRRMQADERDFIKALPAKDTNKRD